MTLYLAYDSNKISLYLQETTLPVPGFKKDILQNNYFASTFSFPIRFSLDLRFEQLLFPGKLNSKIYKISKQTRCNHNDDGQDIYRIIEKGCYV